MASYKVVVEKRVLKDLRKIPQHYQKKIWQKIGELAIDPFQGDIKQLSSRPEYRVRQGVYRILYEVHSDIVEVRVVRVGHRKEVYDKLK